MTKISDFLTSATKFTPAVVCYPVRNDEVLLIKRKKTSWGLGQNLISGIGGKVGDQKEFEKETHDQALIRECQEEIELTPTAFRNAGTVKFIFMAKPAWNLVVVIYVVTAWKGNPKETEVAKPVWHKKYKLPKDQMWEDNALWVPKVLAGRTIEAAILYGPDNKTVIDYLLK